MNEPIGFVGLGKLGLPCAVAMSLRRNDWLPQHRVLGYDVDERKMRKRNYEHKEQGDGLRDFQQCFDEANLEFADLPRIVKECKLIFVAVQTPHEPRFDGTVVVSEDRADFDYRYLEQSIRQIVREIRTIQEERTISIISTVLPGTIRQRIKPLLPAKCRLVYNPFFAAMGTVIHDFLFPEFVLLGADDPESSDAVGKFYANLLPDALQKRVNIESAELIKVAYNLFISQKICYANTLMEMAHKIPNCDVDEVSDALSSASRRLLSPAYMRGGMGDGGECHPRDVIAMSWLAKELKISFNLFETILECREHQTGWLADIAEEIAAHTKLPIVLLGKAFKPETTILGGSCALLLRNILLGRGLKPICHDPLLDLAPDSCVEWPKKPAVYLIACKHHCFISWKFSQGSVVIDPHRYIPEQAGVQIIRLGNNSRRN